METEFRSRARQANSSAASRERMQLAAPDAIVMHPGPMNRGIEIEGVVADGPRSVITEQVTNGLAVRMAVLERVANTLSLR